MFENIKLYYQKIVPDLSELAWRDLESRLTVKQIRKGEHFIKSGERCDHVAFVNTGFIRFYNMVDGREICTGFIGENEYMSEYASFLTRKPAQENIDAIEDTELWLLHHDDMQKLYKVHPIYETFARKLAEFLFIMVADRTHALLVLSPEERYRHLVEKQSELLQKIPQYMLASYIGVTPEHLSRIRKKMIKGW